jgi:hypothetical protein
MCTFEHIHQIGVFEKVESVELPTSLPDLLSQGRSGFQAEPEKRLVLIVLPTEYVTGPKIALNSLIP